MVQTSSTHSQCKSYSVDLASFFLSPTEGFSCHMLPVSIDVYVNVQ